MGLVGPVSDLHQCQELRFLYCTIGLLMCKICSIVSNMMSEIYMHLKTLDAFHSQLVWFLFLVSVGLGGEEGRVGRKGRKEGEEGSGRRKGREARNGDRFYLWKMPKCIQYSAGTKHQNNVVVLSCSRFEHCCGRTRHCLEVSTRSTVSCNNKFSEQPGSEQVGDLFTGQVLVC